MNFLHRLFEVNPLSNRERTLFASLAAATLLTTVSASIAEERSFELGIVNGALPEQQRRLTVTKDDNVRLRVTSDVAGELHLHAYRIALKLTPGEPKHIGFKAFATGRFPFEWHGTADAKSAKQHSHGGFGVIEVHPK